MDVIYTAIEDNIESADLADIMRKIQNVVDESIDNMFADEDNIESADLADIMRKIQNVVDESIDNMFAEPSHIEGKVIDLSGLDFDLLEQYFLKTKNKNAAVKSLNNKIEQQLNRMVERNPLTVDGYIRYQEIIEEYKRRKDEVVINETFRKLIELVNAYSEDEADTDRDGITNEHKPSLTF